MRMPLGETFFSQSFEMVVDRFRVLWMAYVAAWEVTTGLPISVDLPATTSCTFNKGLPESPGGAFFKNGHGGSWRVPRNSTSVG